MGTESLCTFTIAVELRMDEESQRGWRQRLYPFMAQSGVRCMVVRWGERGRGGVVRDRVGSLELELLS